jgi:hypothetical protein
MNRSTLMIMGYAIALVFFGPLHSTIVIGQDVPNGTVAPAATDSLPPQSTSGGNLFPLTHGKRLLITQDIEHGVIERFKGGFVKQRSPRVSLLINLDSLPESDANVARARIEIEGAFSKPLRAAGVTLVKGGISPQGTSDQRPENADFQIEVVFSTKPYVWSGLTLVVTNNLLDVRAQASLPDGRILGHALSSDFVPEDREKAFALLTKVGTAEIVKAAALTLMDDIMISVSSNPTLADGSPPSGSNSGNGQTNSETSPQSLPGADLDIKPPESDKTTGTETIGNNNAVDNSAPSELKGRKSHDGDTNAAASTSAPVNNATGQVGEHPTVENQTSSISEKPDSFNSKTNFLTAAVLNGLARKAIGEM